MTYGEFMEAVLALCTEFDCSMTSGKRTTRRNALKKGHPRSKHLLSSAGHGQDIVADDITYHPQVVERAHELGLGALHEDVGEPNEHVHLQWPRKKS